MLSEISERFFEINCTYNLHNSSTTFRDPVKKSTRRENHDFFSFASWWPSIPPLSMWSCPRPNILLWQWCHWSFLQIELEESIYFRSLHDSPDLVGCVCPRRSQTSPCLSQCSRPPKLLSRLRSHLQISQKSSRNGVCLDHHWSAWLGSPDCHPSETQWPDIPG